MTSFFLFSVYTLILIEATSASTIINKCKTMIITIKTPGGIHRLLLFSLYQEVLAAAALDRHMYTCTVESEIFVNDVKILKIASCVKYLSFFLILQDTKANTYFFHKQTLRLDGKWPNLTGQHYENAIANFLIGKESVIVCTGPYIRKMSRCCCTVTSVLGSQSSRSWLP